MEINSKLLFAYTLYFLGIVAFIYSFKKENIGLMLITFTMPIYTIRERMYELPFGKDFIDIFVLTIILIHIYKSKRLNEKIIISDESNLPIIIYIMITYLGLIWGSINFGLELPFSIGDYRFQEWKNHIMLPILYFLTVNTIKEKKEIEIFIFVLLISMLLVDKSTYGIFGDRSQMHFSWDRKSGGTFGYLNANVVAAFLISYASIYLGIYFFENNKIKKYLFLGITILSCYCMIFMFSRGAYLAAVILFIYFGIIKKRILLLVVLCFIIFWKAILPPSVIERIEMTTAENGELADSSSAGRLEMWNTSIAKALENPIFGLGYMTFATREIGITKYQSDVTRADPHNMFVEIFTELGLLGFLLFLYLFYKAFKSGWRLYKNSNDLFFKGLGLGFTGCVLSMIICNFFGDRWTYQQIGAFYWVFWGLVVRGNMIDKNVKGENINNRSKDRLYSSESTGLKE